MYLLAFIAFMYLLAFIAFIAYTPFYHHVCVIITLAKFSKAVKISAFKIVYMIL